MVKIVIDDVIGWWPATASAVRRGLDDAGGAPVEVEINSPGGSVTEGIAIYNLLRDYAGEVTTTITSLAASMASYIALAGDRVRVYDNATYMIHNVWSVIAGDHNELRKQADIQEALSGLLARKYAAKSGKDIDEVRRLMDQESWWFGSHIADAGFADEVIGTDGESDPAAVTALARERFAGMTAKMQSEPLDDIAGVSAVLYGCGAGGCSLPRHAAARRIGSMKEFENVSEIQNEGEDMEISEITVQMLADGNPDLLTQIRAEAQQAERERISALRGVDPLGLGNEKYKSLLDEHIEQGKSAAELIVAIHEALVAQAEEQKKALEKAKKERIEDGKNLAEMIKQIEPGTGDEGGGDDKAAKEAAEKEKAIALAKKINERGGAV